MDLNSSERAASNHFWYRDRHGKPELPHLTLSLDSSSITQADYVNTERTYKHGARVRVNGFMSPGTLDTPEYTPFIIVNATITVNRELASCSV